MRSIQVQHTVDRAALATLFLGVVLIGVTTVLFVGVGVADPVVQQNTTNTEYDLVTATHYESEIGETDGDIIFELAFNQQVNESDLTALSVSDSDENVLLTRDDFSDLSFDDGRVVATVSTFTDDAATVSATIDNKTVEQSVQTARETAGLRHTEKSNIVIGGTVAFEVRGEHAGKVLTLKNNDENLFAQTGIADNSRVGVIDTGQSQFEDVQTAEISTDDLELIATLGMLGNSVEFDDEPPDEVVDGGDISGTMATDRVDRDVRVELINPDDNVVSEIVGKTGEFSGEFSFTFTNDDYDQTGKFTVRATDIVSQASAVHNVTVSGDIGKSATFTQKSSRDNVGDTATIPIELSGTETAAIEFTTEGYETTFSVIDEDGNGRVVVAINTFTAGFGDQTAISARGDDRVTDVSAEDVGQALPEGQYDFRTFIANQQQDLSRLILTPMSVNEITTHVTPQDGPTPNSDPAEFLQQQTATDTVAVGDNVAFRVDASGLSGATDNLERANGVSLTITNTQQSFSPVEYTPSDSEVRVTQSPNSNDIYLVSLDTQFIQVGNYRATLTVDGDEYPFVPAGETRTTQAEISITQPSATFAYRTDNTYRITSGGTFDVAGETNLAPGTDVTVAVSGETFIEDATGTVTTDGRFSVPITLGSVGTDQDVTIDVSRDVGLDLIAETQAVFAETPEQDVPDREAKLQEQITQLEDELTASESTIADLRNELAALNNTVSTQQSLLEARNQTINDLRSQLSEQRNITARLESELTDIKSQNSTLTDQIERILTAGDVETVDEAVQQLENTTRDSTTPDSGAGNDSNGLGPGFGIAGALVALITTVYIVSRSR